MSLFNGDINYPYRLLELSHDFDLQQLKTQYKKMVFRYHPDKRTNIASSTEFKILTTCYKYLLDKLKAKDGYGYGYSDGGLIDPATERGRERESCHASLKETYNMQMSQDQNHIHSGNNFNVNKFNKEYDMHKYGDPIASRGYQDFLDRQDPEEDLKINDGNNGYDVLLQESQDKIDPQPLDGIDLSDCYELGGEYKNLGRTSISSKGLHYMDLLLAHTTSQIVDQRCKDKLPNYRTLDELKSERKMPIQLSRIEQIELEQNRQREELHEERQRQRALERDRDIQRYHARRNNVLK